jgi:uncharacterized membrane protein
MELLVAILVWIHLSAVAVGGAAAFGGPIVGRRLAGASVETRAQLFGIAAQLSTLGRAAVAVLIVTGPLIVWLEYGGFGGLNFWFWIKMALLVIFLAVIVLAGLSAKRARGGDMEAAKRMPMLSMASMVIFLAILFSAVMSFS